MQHIGNAVDKVRKQENKVLLAQKDDRLKGIKYIWLYRKDNMPDRYRPSLDALKSSTLKVAKAWAMKESFAQIWDYIMQGNALNYAKRWLKWAIHSNLKPMQEIGALIKRHVANIVTFCKHRITNGVAEGLPPRYSVAQAIGRLKGKSAILIHKRLLKRGKNLTGYHFWARRYCVSTVGLDEAVVREYIRNQETQDRQADGQLLLPMNQPCNPLGGQA